MLLFVDCLSVLTSCRRSVWRRAVECPDAFKKKEEEKRMKASGQDGDEDVSKGRRWKVGEGR